MPAFPPMRSAAFAPAAPVSGAAQRRRPAPPEQAREVYVRLLGVESWHVLAVYTTTWERDEDWGGRSFARPVVELFDVLSLTSGASLRNAAGRAQCARLERQLEEQEAHAGPPEPYRFAHHYD